LQEVSRLVAYDGPVCSLSPARTRLLDFMEIWLPFVLQNASWVVRPARANLPAGRRVKLRRERTPDREG
ncbi:MAG: hypothetical protein ACE5ID_01995, partial [Acidobacteriota bacterium]